MKILTWNINGIRAVQREKTTLKEVLDSLGADVVCLQETKVTRDMLDEPTAEVDGYESYFSFSRKRTGYSGTANYCKTVSVPCKAEEGLTGRLSVTDGSTSVCQYGNMNCFTEEKLQALDDEGRCVITQHRILLPSDKEKEVAIINVYVPRSGDREDRHEYKLEFLTALQIRAEALLKSGVHVIILGDINTTHQKLDNCDPHSDEEFLRNSSRIWLNRLLQPSEKDKSIPLSDDNISALTTSDLNGGLFSDVFRQLHPGREDAFTNWCSSTGARQTNYGRRLDYILIDTELAKSVTHSEIMSQVEGSDHCPVIVTLNCSFIASSQSPSLCSKFMPEFRGRQVKLSSFFTKTAKPSHRESALSQNQTCSNSEQYDLSHSQIDRAQSTSNLKRHQSSEAVGVSKKTKLKMGVSDSKQISLTSFFSQSNKVKHQNNQTQNTTHKQDKSKNSIKQISNRDAEHPLGSKFVVDKITLRNSDESKVCNSDNNDFKVGEGDDIRNNHDTSKELRLSSQIKPVVKSGTSSSATAWKGLLGGLPPPPLCPGHKEVSVLRTVKKAGPNKNKQFYVCGRPDGAPGNKEGRCNFFQWVGKKK